MEIVRRHIERVYAPRERVQQWQAAEATAAVLDKAAIPFYIESGLCVIRPDRIEDALAAIESSFRTA